MKTLSLSITLIGIFVLALLLNLHSPIIVDNSLSLSKLEVNSKVQTTGRVISERRLYENTNLIILNSNIEIICDSCPIYQNKTLSVIGIIEKYQNKTQIQALKIVRNNR